MLPDSGFRGDLIGRGPHDPRHSPNRGMPLAQFRQPPCYFGCGDYQDWIAYEAAAWRKEHRVDSQARFADCVDLPPEIYAMVDGQVVSAVTGQSFEPIQDQIAKLTAKYKREHEVKQRRGDREALKPILDLYSIFSGGA